MTKNKKKNQSGTSPAKKLSKKINTMKKITMESRKNTVGIRNAHINLSIGCLNLPALAVRTSSRFSG